MTDEPHAELTRKLRANPRFVTAPITGAGFVVMPTARPPKPSPEPEPPPDPEPEPEPPLALD